MSDYTRHWTRRLIYTAGVKFLADEAGAHWLVDACASWLPHKKLRGEGFIVFKLDVHPNKSATLTADDGNGNILVTQQIEFTDYPESHAELYVVRTPGQPDVLMLPCEY